MSKFYEAVRCGLRFAVAPRSQGDPGNESGEFVVDSLAHRPVETMML